jgi:hypothetical protein
MEDAWIIAFGLACTAWFGSELLRLVIPGRTPARPRARDMVTGGRLTIRLDRRRVGRRVVDSR